MYDDDTHTHTHTLTSHTHSHTHPNPNLPHTHSHTHRSLHVSRVYSAIWTVVDEDCRSRVIHSTLNRLVQKRRHIFLLIAMSCTENHHTVLRQKRSITVSYLPWYESLFGSRQLLYRCVTYLYRERVQMIEHHVVGFWQQGRITLKHAKHTVKRDSPVFNYIKPRRFIQPQDTDKPHDPYTST